MRIDPAHTIIEKLGGVGIVASTLGVNRQAVWKWTQPKNKSGGTGGLIPQRHHLPLLDLARSRDISLTAAEFLPSSEKESA